MKTELEIHRKWLQNRTHFRGKKLVTLLADPKNSEDMTRIEWMLEDGYEIIASSDYDIMSGKFVWILKKQP